MGGVTLSLEEPLARRVLQPAGKALMLGWRALEPAGRASEPAGRPFESAKRTVGREWGTKKQ